MRAMFRLASLLPALICLPLLAFGQVVPNPDKGAMDEAKVRKKMLADKYLQGVLIENEGEGDEKIAVLKAEYEVRKANPEGQKKYSDLLRQYQAAAARRDVNQAKALYAQCVEAAKLTYDVDKTPLEFKIKITKDTKVRREELPPKDADDPKVKYTAAELAKLKGTAGLPGYVAELKDIEINDTQIQVFVDKSKIKAPAPAKPDPKAKEKDKDAEAAPEEQPVYTVTMIIITKPPMALPGNPFLGK